MQDVLAKRLAVQRDLSRALASARSVDAAGAQLLESIGRTISCVVAEIWVVERERLRSAATWAANDATRTFLSGRPRTFARGDGLPGQVWARGEPVWMPDVSSDASFARRAEAIAAGLLTAVSFPISFEGAVSGVVQFIFGDRVERDATFTELFADIGEQLGLFLERARVDALALARAEEIIELSAPMLSVARGTILLPVIGSFDAARASLVTDRLLTRVVELEASHVVLDLTNIGEVDTFVAQRMNDAIVATKLLGARTILTGVPPKVARTFVMLGIRLDEVDVYTTLADGLAALGRGRESARP